MRVDSDGHSGPIEKCPICSPMLTKLKSDNRPSVTCVRLSDVRDDEEWRSGVNFDWLPGPGYRDNSIWVEVRPKQPKTEMIPWHATRGRKAKFDGGWSEVTRITADGTGVVLTADSGFTRWAFEVVAVLVEDDS